MYTTLTAQVAAEHQRDLRRQADAWRVRHEARRSRPPRPALSIRLGWRLVGLGLRLVVPHH